MFNRLRTTFRYTSALLVLVIMQELTSMVEGSSTDVDFVEEMILRTVADRHLEVTWNFTIEFQPTTAHLCSDIWGGEGRKICHFDQFPPDIAAILQLSKARQFALSLGAGRWQPHWGPSSFTPQALHRQGNHQSTEARSSIHGPCPDGTRIEADFGADEMSLNHNDELWINLRRALGGLLSVEMVPESPSTAAHYWPPVHISAKNESIITAMRVDFPREKPGLENLWPWLRLMPCSTGQPNIPLKLDSNSDTKEKPEKLFGLASLLNSEVFLGGEYFSLFLKATQNGCSEYENNPTGSKACTMALTTTLTTLLRDVVTPLMPGPMPSTSDSGVKPLGFSLASLLDASKYNDGFRSLRNGPFSESQGTDDSEGAAAADAVDAQLSGLRACPMASNSLVRTIIPSLLTGRPTSRLPDIDVCDAISSKEECTSGSSRRVSFATPPVQEYSRTIELLSENATWKGVTKIQELRETVHDTSSISNLYGSSDETLLAAAQGSLKRNQRSTPASAAIPWAVIESPRENIPTAETSETWFDRQSISATKRLLWNDAWRETVAIDSVVNWGHVSAYSNECIYAHFTEPIMTELTLPIYHTFRLNIEASPVVQSFNDVTSEEWTHLPLSLRDLPHHIMTENDRLPTHTSPAPQSIDTVVQILLPLSPSCLQPDLIAEYPALSASLERLHHALNDSHDIHIFSSYDFTPTVISMEHWPPDQARGFELPGASAALVHNISGVDFLPVFESCIEAWTHSPGLLYLPPLLDFSMPFNLMTLNSTLCAGLFGTILNILTKIPRRKQKKKKKKKEKKEKAKEDEAKEGDEQNNTSQHCSDVGETPPSNLSQSSHVDEVDPERAANLDQAND